MQANSPLLNRSRTLAVGLHLAAPASRDSCWPDSFTAAGIHGCPATAPYTSREWNRLAAIFQLQKRADSAACDVMPFIHIFLNVGRTERYEFGFTSECSPCVGDVVDLFLREPDTTESDSEMIECRVVKRQWFFGYHADGEDECELTVETSDPIPEGYVPDSEAWPSETWSERKALLREIIPTHD